MRKEKKQISLMLKMLEENYEELMKTKNLLDSEELKLQYYLLIDKIEFLYVVLGRDEKRQLDNLLSKVESSYENDLNSSERIEIADSLLLTDSDSREKSFVISNGTEVRGFFECRVVGKSQVDILKKYINLGKKGLSSEEIEKDIKDYLINEESIEIENLSGIEREIIKELLGAGEK